MNGNSNGCKDRDRQVKQRDDFDEGSQNKTDDR